MNAYLHATMKYPYFFQLKKVLLKPQSFFTCKMNDTKGKDSRTEITRHIIHLYIPFRNDSESMNKLVDMPENIKWEKDILRPFLRFHSLEVRA